MRHFDSITFAIPLAAWLIVGIGPAATADDFRFGNIPIKASLVGFEEVAVAGNATAPGTLFSPGRGSFVGRIDHGSIEFILRYAGLETPVLQAHIHFGQRHTNGGVVAFLCTNLSPPAGVPEPEVCPATEGEVKGVITAADVGGGAGAQGIAAGEFDKLVKAILVGAAYANVHTEAHPAGELRGQIKTSRRSHR
jgi:hypothetical protein